MSKVMMMANKAQFEEVCTFNSVWSTYMRGLVRALEGENEALVGFYLDEMRSAQERQAALLQEIQYGRLEEELHNVNG